MVKIVDKTTGHAMITLAPRVILLASASLSFAASAHAQVGGTAPAVDYPASGEAIVVTGTRLRAHELESPVPVTTVAGDEFFETGKVAVGDVLNELPMLRSTFSQQNSTRALGTAGLGLLDLRGLGIERTLVLQNGRRHVAADVLGTGVAVDVNTIPADLIERVDIVTGGNSAVYGSDAIAGVVNFILKDDYEGIQLRGQNGISKYKDAGSSYVSALAGTNFADGRGNIAVNVAYSRQADFYASDRPPLGAYLQLDSDPVGAPNGSDGVPDRVFVPDVRYGFYADGGTFVAFDPAVGAVPYIFQPNGDLVLQTGQRYNDLSVPVPLFSGGNGSNARSGHQAGLRPKVDRYSANLIGHFELSPGFVPFIEAKYARADTLSNNAGPFFDDTMFSTDNPFLSGQAETLIRNLFTNLYNEPAFQFFDFPFIVNRAVTDLGNREEKTRRETYRIVGGVRGDLTSNWRYEASLNHGEYTERTTIRGNVNRQRYALSADAVLDPASGNVVCRSQLGPVPTGNPRLAADIAACVPGNYFGEGNLSQAARNYVVHDTVTSGKISQFVANAFVSGDTAETFAFPGGPIGVVLGAEYRKDTLSFDQDPLVAAGLTSATATPSFDPPSFEVKEVFGELRFPILANAPFAHELTASVAGRISDYKGSTGTVYAYNGSVRYAPIADVMFRANYSRAVRAPNLANLYTPLGQNFATNFNDPCSAIFLPEGSANRAANCRADGVPVGFNYLYSRALALRSGGNPDLKEETSDSWTIGAVVRPSLVPGLSLSVDYFDIEVDNVITTPSAQQIVEACYDASDLDNQFCSLFQRAGAGGGPNGEIAGRILEGSLQAIPFNYARLKVRGIDVDLRYTRQFNGVGLFNGRVYYTHMFQNDEFLDLTDPGRANQLLMELNYPEDSINFDMSLRTGKVTFGYQMRYIGRAVLNEYEDLFSKQGRAPQNADYAEDKYYRSVVYHDIRLAAEVDERFELYAGIDNMTNRLPPQGLTGTSEGSGAYDTVGRYMYAGFVARF